MQYTRDINNPYTFRQMPLRAYIEDKEIVSIDLNDEEWSALKARLKAKEIVLTLPCCGQEGF